MNLPVVMLGAGGHAKVLIEALRAVGAEIIGAVDPDLALVGTEVHGVPVLGDDETVLKFSPDNVHLANGLGSVGLPVRRQELFNRFKAKGYTFATVIHPSALIASAVELGEGVQIMAGVVIQPGCCVGVNTILNTRVSIDHDCRIGDHVHIAPGVTFSGNVSVGHGSHVGPGSTVVQGINIGKQSVVGAGSLILKRVVDGATVYGVPARDAKW